MKLLNVFAGVVHRDLKPDNIIIIPPERAGDGSAYDEVALELMNIALRDAIFGVFVGIILSAIRLRRPSKTYRSHWASLLLTYGSIGAAIAMLPFVLLRTTMFLLPVGVAILGLVAGLIICGIKILIQRFAKKD